MKAKLGQSILPEVPDHVLQLNGRDIPLVNNRGFQNSLRVWLHKQIMKDTGRSNRSAD
jgi:hypothetical protein